MFNRRRFLANVSSAAVAAATLALPSVLKRSKRASLAISNDKSQFMCPAFCHTCGAPSLATKIRCPLCKSDDYSIWNIPDADIEHARLLPATDSEVYLNGVLATLHAKVLA